MPMFGLREGKPGGTKLDWGIPFPRPARRPGGGMAGRLGTKMRGKQLLRLVLSQDERQGNHHHQEGRCNNSNAP
jgi:hypothetical protein